MLPDDAGPSRSQEGRPRRAVVDVGSNSVLLLVSEKRGDLWQPVEETSALTALGENTRTTGVLGEKGMAATLAALKSAFAAAESYGAESTLAAVTMAGRIAKNTPDFIARASAQGTPVTVLSGEQEANLGFLAVAEDPAFASFSKISVVDVGGHSTELINASRSAEGWDIAFRKSFDIGTLGLRETILGEESPPPEARLRAAKRIDDTIGLNFAPDQVGTAVTVGATGTNLVSIRERMTEWRPEQVHGAILDYEEIGRAVGWMFGMTDHERAQIIGIEPGREKTLHIGALILERFLHAIKASECRVSVRGWRYALLEHPL